MFASLRLSRIVLGAACACLLVPAPCSAEDDTADNLTEATTTSGVMGAELSEEQRQAIAAARAANLRFQTHLATVQHRIRNESGQLSLAEQLEAIDQADQLRDASFIPTLLPLLQPENSDTALVLAAMRVLTHYGAEEASESLERLLYHPDNELRTAAFNSLALLEKLDARDYQRHSSELSYGLRATSTNHLAILNAEEAGPILAAAVQEDKHPYIRRMAAHGLGMLGDTSYGPMLAQNVLFDANPGVRKYAAIALRMLDYKPAVPYLLMGMELGTSAEEMNRSLQAITGEDFGFDHRANAVEQAQAIRRGREWWAQHSKN